MKHSIRDCNRHRAGKFSKCFDYEYNNVLCTKFIAYFDQKRKFSSLLGWCTKMIFIISDKGHSHIITVIIKKSHDYDSTVHHINNDSTVYYIVT